MTDKRENLAPKDETNTFRVNEKEVGLENNRAKGIKTPGLVKYEEYTDAQGNVRRKAETLVPIRNRNSIEEVSVEILESQKEETEDSEETDE